jgi:hypothetical protein
MRAMKREYTFKVIIDRDYDPESSDDMYDAAEAIYNDPSGTYVSDFPIEE